MSGAGLMLTTDMSFCAAAAFLATITRVEAAADAVFFVIETLISAVTMTRTVATSTGVVALA